MNSPYLLSGILFCGLCGAAMVGDSARSYRCYECGRQHREGRAVCDQHKVATWHVERFVTNWVADHVLTFDYLRQSREEINRALSGDRSALEARRERLLSDLSLIDKRVRRLIDSIETLGLTSEIRVRLRERKAEARQMETELAGVEAALRQQRIEVSDEALGYVAEHMREELKAGKHRAGALNTARVDRARGVGDGLAATALRSATSEHYRYAGRRITGIR